LILSHPSQQAVHSPHRRLDAAATVNRTGTPQHRRTVYIFGCRREMLFATGLDDNSEQYDYSDS
jgi:hypothetical protein